VFTGSRLDARKNRQEGYSFRELRERRAGKANVGTRENGGVNNDRIQKGGKEARGDETCRKANGVAA